MTVSTARGVRHLKERAAGAARRLEPCEDGVCLVESTGLAGCGRVACPACGFSGANLMRVEPGAEERGVHVFCSCGNAWILPSAALVGGVAAEDLVVGVGA